MRMEGERALHFFFGYPTTTNSITVTRQCPTFKQTFGITLKDSKTLWALNGLIMHCEVLHNMGMDSGKRRSTASVMPSLDAWTAAPATLLILGELQEVGVAHKESLKPCF